MFGGFGINPPQWSLFYELLAYLGFALFVPRTRSTVLLMAAAAGFAAFGFIDPHLRTYTFRRAVLFNAPFAMAAYITGVLLWRSFRKGITPSVHLPLPLLSLPIAAACMCPFRFGVGVGVDLFSVLLVFPLVILTGAAGGRRPSGRLTVWLGDVSFPLYIVHYPVVLAVKDVAAPHLRARFVIAISMLASIALATAFMELFDKPVRAWMVGTLRTRAVFGREQATVSA